MARLRRIPPIGLALADQAMISGANFITIIAVARASEVADFGLFTLAFSVLLFLLNLVYALVNLPLAVLLPEREGPEVNAYLARLERVHRALVPILFVVALPFLGIFASWPLVVATALGTATRMAAEYHRRVAYSLHDSARALAIDCGAHGLLALAAVGVLLLSVRIEAWHAMAVVAATGLIGWGIGLVVNRKVMRAPVPESIAAVARRHWAFGKWNLGGTLALWSASQLYPFLIAGMIGLHETALVNGSLRIMGVTNVLIQGLDSFATPRLRTFVVAGDMAAYRRFLALIALIGTGAMLVITGAVFAFPEAVLSLTLGPEYAHGGFVMRVIALSMGFTFIARIAGMGLNALKEARPGFWGQVACAIVTIVAGPWIITEYGLEGACVALLVNSVLNAVVLVWAFLARLRRVAPQAEPTS